MWPYFLMFLIPALAAMGESARPAIGRNRLAWSITFVVLTAVIGYRFRVGGDWETYLVVLDRASRFDFFDYLFDGDPSYQLLNWTSDRLGWGIYGVNLATGAIFSFGLMSFCRAQLQPWLALAVAVPYLVIVVGMGYSRQAAALGLEMLALDALVRQRVALFLYLVFAAATFHKSAITLLFLLIFLVRNMRQLFYLTTSLSLLLMASASYVLDTADSYSKNYIDTVYESQGATLRLLLNMIPSLIVLLYRSHLVFSWPERRLWTCLAVLSMLCLFLLYLLPYSTAIDRVALYLLPLQIVVFSRLPMLTSRALGGRWQISWGTPITLHLRSIITLVVLVFYGTIEVVWLTRADTAYAWLPYRSFLFDE